MMSLTFGLLTLVSGSGPLGPLVNHDLGIIHAWASSWLVAFNPNKTEAILFTLKHDIRNPKLIFNDTVVKFVESHKHLGVTLERNGQCTDYRYEVFL